MKQGQIAASEVGGKYDCPWDGGWKAILVMYAVRIIAPVTNSE
jgi:hypothetical protein